MKTSENQSFVMFSKGVDSFLWKPFLLAEAILWCKTWRPLKYGNKWRYKDFKI